MTALSFVWVHPYSQISGCDTTIPETSEPEDDDRPTKPTKLPRNRLA